jgi:hypothetical protein
LLYWCHDMLKWGWKKTRFYKVSWQNSKCRPRRSLSPSDHPRPSIPNFTYPTQIVWFWVQPALQATTYVLRLHFGWVQMLSLGKWTVKFDDDVEQIQNLVYNEKLLYPCMTLFI